MSEKCSASSLHIHPPSFPRSWLTTVKFTFKNLHLYMLSFSFFTFTCTFTITSCTLSHLQTAESTTSIVTKWNGHNLAGFSVKRGFVSRCQQQSLSCTQPNEVSVESIYCRNMLRFSDTALPSGFEWAQLDERLNCHTLLDAVGSRAMPSSGCQSHSLTSRAGECQF